ncbi:extracellular solute-binding protein [Peribacillus deserti]|nr:extracellular solute-binding protein [Peribacillus deserti]
MKTKKLKLSLVVMLVLSLLLAACSGDKTTGDNAKGKGDKIKLSIWHNYAGDDLRAKAVRKQIDQFEKEHPEVELDKQAIPVDGYRQRLKTVAAANEMPDVFYSYSGSFTEEFYKGNLIQPVSDLWEKKPDWAEKFLPGSKEIFTYDNEVYSAPVGMSATSFLYYNRDLFEKYNVKVPTTWDELMEAIKVFNKNKITPIALGNKATWPAQSSVFGVIADHVTGTEWFMKAIKSDGATFNDPQFIEALNYFKDLVDAKAFQEGANSIDNTQAEQYFVKGNAAMMINGSWAITNLAASSNKEELDKIEVTVVPSIEGGKGKPNTMTGGPGGGFLMSSKVKDKKRELALELMYAISGPEAQKAIAESESLVMYDVDIDESKVSSLYNKAYELVKTVNFAPVYDLYLSSAGGEAINQGLQELMLGGKPKEVAKKLQDAQSKAVK